MDGTPPRATLTPAADAVFVGEHTQFTAVFDGDSASIDGIGPVQSGVAVDTPALSRTTTFTLRVVFGDAQAEAQATVRANYRNRIRVLADAPTAQTNHIAAALPDGRAIVMGGNTSASVLVPDSTLSQVFDPATEKFTAGPDLMFSAQAQQFTSFATLETGGFLLVGSGIDGPPRGPPQFVVTQQFDPATSKFTRVGDAFTGSTAFRTATPLPDGGALLTGGLTRRSSPVNNVADRYDAVSSQWRSATPMLHVRVLHTATLLNDGRVLVVGGLSCCQFPNPSTEFFTNTAEIYDPALDRFTPTGSMTVARGGHAAAILPDGRVLISGGSNDPGPAPLGTEIFDPATGQFSPGGDLRAARDSHAAVTLTDGRVLVLGGEAPPEAAGRVGVGVPETEIFDPSAGRWTAGPRLDPAFFAATVTMLGNGKVLVFGGQDAGGFPVAKVAIFE